ncbi:hypothetical protein CBP76_11945 [Companilactobacillus nuruki]|uniref:Uncharacterized protein n=1 Tax=Companilactobacillus nuruki TaxID=1993540 RepID=A0A2N7ARE6_9LACO|nr:hypothetical protein CBP76_11945 [Companilactobacillus nuruki]
MNRVATNLKQTLLINSKKIYVMNYLILFITSLLYALYVAIIKTTKGIDFQELLKSSPYTSIMFIVILLNVLVGYILWINSNNFFNSKKNRSILLDLSICQLIIGNIFSFFAFVATFLSFKYFPNTKSDKKTSHLVSIVIIANIFYGLCFLLLIRLTLS